MLVVYPAGPRVAPPRVAYSLQSQYHAKLREVARLLEPGLVYVSDTAPFAKALAALSPAGIEIAAGKNGANLPRVTAFSGLAPSKPGPAGATPRARHIARKHHQLLLTHRPN